MCPFFIVFNTFFCFCRRKELNSQQFYDKYLNFRRLKFMGYDSSNIEL